MKFQVYGPIMMPKKEMRATALRKAIDENLSDDPETLKAWKVACGCYVFAIGKKGGARPWYVGKTTNTFRQQCINGDKPTMYRTLLRKQSHGTPMLYLVAQIKPTRGDFAAPNSGAIEWLESLLIAKAYKRNKNLENIQKTDKVKNLEVAGFLGKGKRARTGPAKSLRKVFGT